MTKGMIDILKDDQNNLNELKDIIITKFKENNNNINISQILNEFIDKKIKEKEKLNENNKIENNNNENKKENINKNHFNSVYVGKEDFEEENETINELKKNKYKEIIDLNKDEYYNWNDKYNITCALIKLLDKKYPEIEVKEKEKETENNKKDENHNIKNDITKEKDINEKKENKNEMDKENKIENEKKEIEDVKKNVNEENKNEEKKEEIEKNNKED